MNINDRIRGTILGTAVGDSVGLPAEGISRRRNSRMYKGKWKHRLLFSRGMISDDTEHTIFVAQSLITSSDSSEYFARRLAGCFRWWFLSLPAGIGLATLKSIFKLWLGFSPANSGVFSAGNGPSMRSAPIGAFFANHPEKIDEFTLCSTRITHTDPKAYTGAKAVADITAWIIREDLTTQPEKNKFIRMLLSSGRKDNEWKDIVDSVSSALDKNFSVSQFAELIGQGNGISGYVYHTVPVTVYAWYKHFGDFKKTLISVLNCGGDTDTTGAIAGAMAGTVVGEGGIPGEWITGIFDWPRGLKLLGKISDRLADKIDDNTIYSPIKYFWPGILPRNAAFLAVVLFHGFRRMLPPY